MKKKVIPEKVLKTIPIRYRFLDQISFRDKKNHSSARFIKSNYYNAEQTLCKANYRKTSKLLIQNENK